MVSENNATQKCKNFITEKKELFFEQEALNTRTIYSAHIMNFLKVYTLDYNKIISSLHPIYMCTSFLDD